MIPILYSQNETDFTSNGLGKLSDAISCTVTEERNGQYELSMTYPITGLHFSEIAMSSLIKAVPADGKGAQLFRVYHMTKPINGIVGIDAEHVSYQLSHIPVTPFTANNVTSALTGLKENAAESCPFEFWTDKSTSANFSVKEPVSIRSRLGGTQGSVLDIFGGGEYEFDNYTVKLHQNRGIDRGVTLRYGKNITDIKQEENIASTYTGIMPYWKGTNDSQEEYIVTLTEKVLHSANASNFPYQRTIPLDLSSEFETEPTQAQLRARAQAYMTSNDIGVPMVSIDVSFVALWQTEEYKDIANLERVNLCDTVTVYFPMLEISATAKVVKTVYNVLQDRYDSVELGDAKTTLTQTIRSDINKSAASAIENLPTKSFLQKSLDRATQLLTGGLGGFVRYTLNADGEPQEILIMDTDDIQTAVNVIRLNKNGIGFSTNGYDGPFISAWTIDGNFVADFIKSGTLDAELIKAGYMKADRIQGGTLTLGGENNDNGVMVLKNDSNNTIMEFNKDGLFVYKGIIKGSEIISRGERFVDSLLTGCYVTLDDGMILFGESGYNVTDPTRTVGRLYVAGSINIESRKDFIFSRYISSADEYQRCFVLENTTTSGDTIKTRARVFGTVTVEGDGDIGFFINKRGGWTGSYGFEAGYNSLGTFTGINCTGVLYEMGNRVTTSSSKRYKHDINDIVDEELDPKRLLELKPKQFIYNHGEEQYQDTIDMVIPGFIAEDVDEIYPSAVIHDNEGNIGSWDERRIIPGMLALIQEQHKKIQSLENRLSKLEEIFS